MPRLKYRYEIGERLIDDKRDLTNLTGYTYQAISYMIRGWEKVG
jgi:hypothetical protein